jgi:hypothetical protein
MEPRKVILLREQLRPEPGAPAGPPITRAAGLVCFENPLVGVGFANDLSILFDAGRFAGKLVSADLVKLLDGSPVSYGKAAIVGISGFMEHGAACIHPKLGKPMRDAVGGGKAVIPSNCKVANAGAMIDVPLCHKDDAWSFAHFDTMTVGLPDGPSPSEIVVIVAMADGGRTNPRVGDGPITD